MQIPLYTAIAWYHHRLAPDLQGLSQSEALDRAAAWARADYAAALARRDSLTEADRAAVVQGLVRYSGLDARYVDPKTLTISKSVVTDHLLEDRKLELGRYDAREALPLRDAKQAWGPRQDPSLLPMVDLMEGTSPGLIRYLRDTLGYKSDLLYRGPWGGSFHPDPMALNPLGYADDWMALMWEHGGKSAGSTKGAESHEVAAFRQALATEPRMLVWNISGLYDQSCAERDEALARAAPAFKARVRNSCYRAGHMVYTDLAVRQQMQEDFAHFIHDGVSAQQASDVR
jgi:carboxypeptidase C (cathepsin A)